MIFDLLTSPQGHQFDPRMKILLAFCSACHPCQFDMPHDHLKKICLTPWAPPAPLSPTPEEKNCLTPWVTPVPQVPPLGHGPGDRIKIPSDMFCIFHCENTHKIWFKIL